MKILGKQICKFEYQAVTTMKFDKHFPTERLKPYIKYFVVSESEVEGEYKVFPSSGLVVGFQYRGQLAVITGNGENKLKSAGITGISNTYKIFKNSTDIGTILVYFTEIGFTYFTSHSAHDLFNLSLPLDSIFDKASIEEVQEKLATTETDKKRVAIIEQFLLSQLKDRETDKLIIEAVKLIYQSKGTIKIKELSEKLFISQSPLEKRFRRIVGTTPKKFSSIIRFNSVVSNLGEAKSLSEICYENNFFDHAHLIKDFKQFTGDTPDKCENIL